MIRVISNSNVEVLIQFAAVFFKVIEIPIQLLEFVIPCIFIINLVTKHVYTHLLYYLHIDPFTKKLTNTKYFCALLVLTEVFPELYHCESSERNSSRAETQLSMEGHDSGSWSCSSALFTFFFLPFFNRAILNQEKLLRFFLYTLHVNLEMFC